MKLYDYISLMPDGEELTVWDKDYDMETYFYGGEPEDKWDKAMSDLSKLLTIEEIRSDGVTVNLSEIIERRTDKLDKANLFIECDIDSIMDDIANILAGNVSEEWMEQFVAALS